MTALRIDMEPLTGATEPNDARYADRAGFESYMEDFRQRKALLRKTGELRAFYRFAAECLREEMRDLTGEDETSLREELRTTLAQFERRLKDSLRTADITGMPIAGTGPSETDARASEPRPAPPDMPTSVTIDGMPASISFVPATDETAPDEENSGLALVADTVEQSDVASVGNALSAEVEDSPNADIESITSEENLDYALDDAERIDLHAELEAISKQWAAVKGRGFTYRNGEPNRANLITLVALACKLASVRAAGYEQSEVPICKAEIRRLYDEMTFERTYTGELISPLPFDEISFDKPSTEITAGWWADLATRYERMSEAEPAWNWFRENQDSIHGGIAMELLNSIAASEQAVWRMLSEFQAFDSLQRDLHAAVSNQLDNVGFLAALSPKISITELDELAEKTTQRLAVAGKYLEHNKDAEERTVMQQTAIHALVAYIGVHNELGKGTERQELDAKHLYLLLDACLEAKVPPTNVVVREALMRCAEQLLADKPKYVKFLKAVQVERGRRESSGQNALKPGDDAAVEELAWDPAFEQERQKAAAFAEGLNILILGGTSNANITAKVKSLLGCAEVKWPSSSKNDTVNRFKSDIRHADIMFVALNFAGHDMSEKGRKWVAETGGEFIVLTSGYGPTQIIHRLYEHINQKRDR